jgi:hypothetical protein
MTFTDEQIQEIEKLAGINYTIKQIAMYLDIKPGALQREFENRESEFRYHYDRGRLISQAKIDQALLDSATKSNLTAINQFEKIRNARHFENLRDQLIYGT